MVTSFKSLSSQGQTKPLFHAEARLHFPELYNGLLCYRLVLKWNYLDGSVTCSILFLRWFYHDIRRQPIKVSKLLSVQYWKQKPYLLSGRDHLLVIPARVLVLSSSLLNGHPKFNTSYLALFWKRRLQIRSRNRKWPLIKSFKHTFIMIVLTWFLVH